MSAYAELAVTTNFSFLRGASHPEEMVATADALGLAAIGIADRNSFAGVVRAYDEWRKRKNIKLLVGTRLVTVDGFEVLAYPTDAQAYGRLCQLLTQGQPQGQERRMPSHLRGHSGGQRRPDADRVAATRVSRAQRSAESAFTRVFDALWRSEVVRCRPGIVANASLERSRIRGAPLRLTASGKRV